MMDLQTFADLRATATPKHSALGRQFHLLASEWAYESRTRPVSNGPGSGWMQGSPVWPLPAVGMAVEAS